MPTFATWPSRRTGTYGLAIPLAVDRFVGDTILEAVIAAIVTFPSAPVFNLVLGPVPQILN